MAFKQESAGSPMTVPAGIGTGTVVSMVVTLVLTGLLAWLISGEKLGEESVGYGAVLILLVAAAAGAYAAVTLVKTKRLMVSILTGLCYLASLLCITVVFFGGRFAGIGVTALVVTAGCGLVILAGLKGEKHPKRRYKKH